MKKKRTLLRFPRGSMAKILLKMKLLTVLLLSVFAVSAANNSYSQQTKFNLKLNNVTVKQVFVEIEENSEFILLYNENIVDVNRKVNVQVKNKTIESVLDKVFEGTKNAYKIYDRQIVILENENDEVPGMFSNRSNVLQQKTVTGKVKDENGESLPGVTVLIKGTTNGTVTNFEGEYTIEGVTSESILQFSFVGMQAQEITVGNQSSINVVLKSDAIGVDEVVVTALGIKRSTKTLGYSVTEVSGERFQENKTVNLGASLSGKVAGVKVTTPSNGVAGSSRIVIRGNSSISGNNQPLFVVDGIPIDNTQLGSPGQWGGTDWGDGLSSLNSDEIESMSVLKGNTAAALYGSRAQNGVILITTKTGKGRKGIGVEINSNMTFDQIIDTYDLQTEYGHGRYGAAPTTVNAAKAENKYSFGGKLDGSMVPYFDGETRPYINRRDNLLKDFYQTGTTFNNNIAIVGGNKDHHIRLSLGHNSTTPTTPNSDFERVIAGVNYTGQITSKLNVASTVKYSWEEAHNRPRIGDYNNNIGFVLATMPNTMDADMAIGNPDKPGTDENGNEYMLSTDAWRQNPYFSAYQFDRGDSRDRVIASTKIRYDFTDWLYLQGSYGLDFWTSKRYDITPSGVAHGSGIGMNENSIHSREINRELMLGFKKDLENFSINAFFGGNQMRREYETYNVSGGDFSIPFVYYMANTKRLSFTKGYTQKGINSLYGSAEFGYKNYLFLTVTGRNDWFSTLDGRGTFYPSVGLSAVATDIMEDMGMEVNKDVLSYAKLRASWAQVGGGADSPYNTNLTYSVSSGTHNGASIGGITQSQIPNAYLNPLTNTEWELGLDLRLFKNRVGIDFSYYNRKTTDDILSVGISSTSGYGSSLMNIGEVENNGVELLVNVKPIDRKLKWDVSFNFAKNNNKVLEIDGSNNEIQVATSRSGRGAVKHIVGMPYSMVVGRIHKTIDGQKVYDSNGYPIITDDFHVLGTGVADKTFGLSNSFQYNKLFCSFLIDAQMGGHVYSASNYFLKRAGLAKSTLEGREGMTVTGVDENGTPGEWQIDPTQIEAYYKRFGYAADNNFYSTDFVKLRELSVGYDFTRLINWNKLREVKLSFVGRNLALLYSDIPNIDPEAALNTGNAQGLEMFGLPTTRNYGFNLSLKF